MSNAEKDWRDSLPDQVAWLEDRLAERDKRIAELKAAMRDVIRAYNDEGLAFPERHCALNRARMLVRKEEQL